MKILGYRLNILTGQFLKLELKESKNFFGDTSILNNREEAHLYALKIQELLKEGIREKIINFKTKNLLKKGVETFSTQVTFVFEDDIGEEVEIVINGDFIENLIPNWVVEAEVFIDNDLTNIVYNLDCSSYGYGNVTVLKETYEMWYEDVKLKD